MNQIIVIGAGLAGCEAAYQLAKRGINVKLYEMKPKRFSPAHHSVDFCELVCSNSLRSNELSNAVGLLKEELRRLDSLVMRCADENAVPAGSALAVDRERFSKCVTDRIRSMQCIEVVEEEVTEIPKGEKVIVATGPLTQGALYDEIRALCGEGYLHFFDAAAPVVKTDTIDMEKVFYAARYGKGEADYINCPMNKQQYDAFYDALVSAETATLKGFENKAVFEGCMPVEVMAKRGREALLFGPLKPVGLDHPETGERYHAVIQLRQDNREGSLYNMVGFQTNLKFGEQKRVFSMIPGLEEAEFVRYGVMHRNTFLNGPQLLDKTFALKEERGIRFAGQITGVEGYIESAASGFVAGLAFSKELGGEPIPEFPQETALGALCHYVSGGSVGKFQPMNVNFGIMTPLGYRIKGKREKNLELAKRSLAVIEQMKGMVLNEA